MSPKIHRIMKFYEKYYEVVKLLKTLKKRKRKEVKRKNMFKFFIIIYSSKIVSLGYY